MVHIQKMITWLFLETLSKVFKNPGSVLFILIPRYQELEKISKKYLWLVLIIGRVSLYKRGWGEAKNLYCLAERFVSLLLDIKARMKKIAWKSEHLVKISLACESLSPRYLLFWPSNWRLRFFPRESLYTPIITLTHMLKHTFTHPGGLARQ